VAKLSFFQTIMQYLFFYIGLANTTGVKASIIEASNVFVAILVSALIFRQEKLTGRKMLGCVAGFAGVLLINLGQGGLSMTFRLNGEGFVFLSTVAYAFSSALLKRYSQKENTVMLSGYQFAFGGMVMIVVGLLGGGAIKTVTPNGIAILIYLAFISAAAYSLWGLLLKYNPVSKISVYGFMNPVFGVILSALLLTEQNGNLGIVKVIISLALVGAGILIVNLGSVPQKIYHSNFKY
jgi:drug/metabolite transporter (DMT)-like permease